ncbi:CRISPR-associated helicase Cas3' [Actinotignum sp. GS-2025b]|uniref:CRISPR-associated helicase Cas3' n=1 Tax=Actinotignum sp. GS-2025b TaxID=3427275 RepID=UPI003F48E61F
MTGTHPSVWAKQRGMEKPYPLLAHLLDTATTAGVLYEVWLRPGLREVLGAAGKREIVEWVAGSHDIGKACPVFQYQPTQREPQWNEIRAALCADEPQLGDIAKWCRDFCEDYRPDIYHHQKISALLLHRNRIKPDADAALSWEYLPALGHHGRFETPSWNDRETKDFFEDMEETGWLALADDLLTCLEEGIGITRADFPAELSPTATILLSGLTVLADRIASGTEWVTAQQELLAAGKLALDNPAGWITACRSRARARIEETVGVYHGWESAEQSQRAILGNRTPRPLQEEATRVGGGLWNVMAPTGVGKTEAALLRHATANERLIFLLPTQATSNALMRRIQRYYAGTPNVASLAHSLASTEDFYNQPVTMGNDCSEVPSKASITYVEHGASTAGLFPTEFVSSGSSRLLAPVCVGTVDQALLGALPAKWTHLRLLALANAHVVVDEVHTLDQYQSGLLSNLLLWLRATNTRVTFLSATLASDQRATYVKSYTGQPPESEAHFPLLENLDTNGTQLRSIRPDGPPRTLVIDRSTEKYCQLTTAHRDWVREQRRRYPQARIGVICNTVARAQELTRALSTEGNVVILHSRMTAEHRRRNAELLEREIGSGSAGAALTVIGTQAIEASLDIDLDLLRTELCPAASLIQRAGRLWRSADPNRATRVPGLSGPRVSVVAINGSEGQQLPYLASELARVEKWLKEHNTIRIPEDCQEFVDTGTLLLADIAEDNTGELNEFAKKALAAIRARNAGYDMKRCLNEDSRVKSFAAMTQSPQSSEDEQSTRLIEVETTRLIVCGDPDIIPGAWTGDPEDLMKLRGSDHEGIRRALRASVPVTVTDRAKTLFTDAASLENAPSLLCRYHVLNDGAAHYDPLIGLVLQGSTPDPNCSGTPVPPATGKE